MSKNHRRAKQQAANRLKKRIFADKIEQNIPKSELWFRQLYESFHHFQDEYNSVFGGYIPDVINKHYKYILEIDGSVHTLPNIIIKDKKKNIRFKSIGYKVIRIKAFDQNSFNNAMKQVCAIRGPHYRPAKILSTTEIDILSREREKRLNTATKPGP